LILERTVEVPRVSSTSIRLSSLSPARAAPHVVEVAVGEGEGAGGDVAEAQQGRQGTGGVERDEHLVVAPRRDRPHEPAVGVEHVDTERLPVAAARGVGAEEQREVHAKPRARGAVSAVGVAQGARRAYPPFTPVYRHTPALAELVYARSIP